jgi:hypothetical protein
MMEWMRASLAIVILACACTDDGSGFAGDYEMVSWQKQEGACGGTADPQTVPADSMWFRLDDVDLEAGTLVGYYRCFELGACEEVVDLYRSFGVAPEGYVTTVASAIEPPCMLGFRIRLLERVDDTTIRIDETLQREVDMTLSGDACSIEEARARRDSMPCVEQSVWTAELRMP